MINVAHDILHAGFTPSLKITFSDGDVVNVDKSGIGLQNTSFADSSDGSTLPIGAAIGKTLTLELLNDGGIWDGYDFFGASIDLTLTYEGGDKIVYKSWTVSQPPEDLGTYITIVCVDEMWRADKPYETQLSYPASVGAVWREACSKCGLTNATTTAAVFNDSIAAPLAGDLTFRQVFGFIAGIAGGNAHIRPDGKIEIKRWYVPDASTDTTQHPTHVFDDWINLTPALHDVTITGISAVIQNDDGEGDTVIVGTDDYVIQVTDNPLITADTAQRYLGNILAAVGGKAIRPFSGEMYFCPVAEFGDPVAIVTQAGDTVYSVISSVSWPLGGKTALQCALEVPLAAGRQYVDPSLSAIIAAKKLVAKERSERVQAIIAMQEALANSSGMYKTEEQQPDGSTIYYLHDKPTLAASANVIKLTSAVIAFSTDGGATWPYGFQITGDMVARLLSAHGISADWITTGTLTVKDDDGKILFSADVGAGQVYIDGISVDDGVVTVGVDDGVFKTTIAPSGFKIAGKNRDVFTVGTQGAYVPHTLTLQDGGKLEVGSYALRKMSDGKTAFVHDVTWMAPLTLAAADKIKSYNSPRIDVDSTTIKPGTYNPSTGAWSANSDGQWLRVDTRIRRTKSDNNALSLYVAAQRSTVGAGSVYSDTVSPTSTSIASGSWTSQVVTFYVNATTGYMHNIRMDLLCGGLVMDCYVLSYSRMDPLLVLENNGLTVRTTNLGSAVALSGDSVAIHSRMKITGLNPTQMWQLTRQLYDMIYPIGASYWFMVNQESYAKSIAAELTKAAKRIYEYADGTSVSTDSRIKWSYASAGDGMYYVYRTQ